MTAGQARLQHAMKALQEHWDATRETWEDKVAMDFEKNHLYPVHQMVQNALRGMQAISTQYPPLMLTT